MKIVFVSDAIYPYNKGGKEKRLYELSTRLAKRGHDVHIYTMHWWKTSEKVRIEEGVQLHALSKYYDLYHGTRRSIKEGVLFGLACLKLFHISFDVLDVDHMPFFPLYSAWLVCVLRLQKRKFHATWHEALSTRDWINYMGKSGHIAALIEKVSTKLPYRITAASPQTMQQLADYHDRTRRVELVMNGVDVQLLERTKPAKVACDVLYAGRFEKNKNIDKLVEAIQILVKDYPEINCTIIGHGTYKPKIKKLIGDLKVNKHVTLLGPLPQAQDVYAIMKRAKVFVLPSVREGFCITVLEALACGMAVVTTDAPANAAKDLVIDGRTGSIVPLEAQAIADAIQFWLTNSATRPNFSVAEYDWDALSQKQAKVYAL